MHRRRLTRVPHFHPVRRAVACAALAVILASCAAGEKAPADQAAVEEGPVEELWSVSLGVPHSVGATADDGAVYVVGDDGTASAYAADDGSRSWTADLAGSPSTAPVVADGVLVVATGRGREGVVTGLDPETGETIWETVTDAAVTAMDVEDPLVIVAASDTLALDPASGDLRWEQPDGADLLAADEGRVVVTSGDRVVVRDARSGSLLWKIDDDVSAGATPAIDGDVVVIAQRSGSVGAHEARSGEELWEVRPVKARAHVWIDATSVYVNGGPEGGLSALDPKNGKTRWFIDLPYEAHATTSGEFLFLAGIDFDVRYAETSVVIADLPLAETAVAEATTPAVVVPRAFVVHGAAEPRLSAFEVDEDEVPDI